MKYRRPAFSGHVLLLAVWAMSLLAGCSHTSKPLFAPNGNGPVWPSPPEQPRIRYVGELRGADDMESDSGNLGDFFAAIFGETEKVELVGPRSVVHPHGSDVVWIGDTGAHCLHQFDLKNHKYRRIIKINGADVLSPVSLAEGPNGSIFVCDSLAGTITQIDIDDGDFLREVLVPADILRPVGVAFDATTGSIFVVDAVAHDVKVLNLDGKLIRTIGKRGTGPGEFNYPSAITWDSQLIWIADSGNHRVQGLTAFGEFVSSIGQAGDAPGDLALPKSVAIDKGGHIYVVDARFENIQVFDRQGNLLLAIGEEGTGPGQFWLPGAIFIDTNDWLWVCDPYNKRVQVFRYLQPDAPKSQTPKKPDLSLDNHG